MDGEPLIFSTFGDVEWIAVYLAAALVILLPRYPYPLKQWLLALLNVAGVLVFFLSTSPQDVFALGLLLGVVVAHWIVLRIYNARGNDDDRIYWIAFLSPIALLIAFKSQSVLHMLGISYLTFRMAQTAFELREYSGPNVGLGEYLAFLIFPPTFSSGPISPFLYYRDTASGSSVSPHNLGVGLLRIAVGYIKFRFLATIAQQLTFTHHWNDGFQHGYVDFVVSGAAYYFYLYLNFSGYTDIAIGISALLGIRVKENFDSPFLARNIRDFWRRWHISLTEFVRDVVFTPLSMTLLRWFGIRFSTAATLIATFVTFTVLALWHGVQPGYFIFYAAHAAAFALNNLTENELRRRGRPVLRAYMENRWIAAASRVVTFLFISVTFAFFELQTWPEIRKIFALMA
jgi:D-alanyl-lipoteichoic acid acyltransferase DltB (MBOAT superfamily)